MRIIDQQKELINKCALSNMRPPSTMNATAAAAADGDVDDLPMMMTLQQGQSITSAVPRPPGKGGAAATEEAAMTGVEYGCPCTRTSSSSRCSLSLLWQRRRQLVRKDTIHIAVLRVLDEGGRRL